MKAAERAIEFVREGHVVGLGTGSTAAFAIKGLGERVRQGLKIIGVPTSITSATSAQEMGIPLADLNEVRRVDVTIDGADEVDPRFNMIKGGGGALTREKLVAVASDHLVIVVDKPKLVPSLGGTRLLPVEVLKFAWAISARELTGLGSSVHLREAGGEPFVTDNGNYILDCDFGAISDPTTLEREINHLPGVVESGLFIGLADTLIIGLNDEVEIRERPRE